MHHDLKSVEPHYGNVKAGIKPMEIRGDDRNFQTGDTVTYHQFDAETGQLTGEKIGPYLIGLVVRHKNFPAGIMPGYCVYAHSLGTQGESNLVKAQRWLKWLWQTDRCTPEQDKELETLINNIDQELRSNR